MKKIPLLEAIATLVGAIIGAGVLGIPYVFNAAGFWTGTFILIIVAGALTIMKLLFGEASLRTFGKHQLSGYAEIYLGKFAKALMSFSMIFGIYGSLLAYTIGQGEVISSITGSSVFWSALFFFVIFSVLIFWGLNIIKRTELIMTSILILVVAAIAILTVDHINLSNVYGFDLSKVFIPYGVVLFACSGVSAVAQVRQGLVRREKSLKKAIIWGSLIPPIVYFLFAVLVIGVSGKGVTEVATVGLGQILGPKMVLAANIFAFFAMATSFLTSGLALKQVYQFDYKIPRFWAWLFTVSAPLALFLVGARDFVQVINIVGALGIGITGILIILIYFFARKNGKRKPEYKIPVWFGNIAGAIIFFVFAIGMIYTIIHL
ncbi:MAG: aromatic amino acid transport family protein [Candidatus Kuenenbacteria bacterium]